MPLLAFAEIQKGYTKTPGRYNANGQYVPGEKLGGVKIETDRGKFFSEENGCFHFTVVDGRFVLKSVTLQGYILHDIDKLKSYFVSPNPLEIVLVKPDENRKDEILKLRTININLQKSNNLLVANLDSLYSLQLISKEEIEDSIRVVFGMAIQFGEQMAERYSKIDFDLLNDYRKEVINSILQGNLLKADSLIDCRGNIEQRRELIEVQQRTLLMSNCNDSTKTEIQTKINEFAEDCYNKYEINVLRHLNDTATNFLELRANIDSTNVQWNRDAGYSLSIYTSNYDKSLYYSQRALRHAVMQEDIAKIYNNMSFLYSKMGDADKAMEYSVNARLLQLEILGEKHPDMALTYSNLGMSYLSQNDLNEAKLYCEKALSIQLENYGDVHPNVATNYGNLGLISMEQNEYEKALDYYTKALNIWINIYGEQHPSVASCYNNIGLLFYKQGKNSEALENHKKALEILLAVLGENHKNVAFSYNTLGDDYFNLGDYVTAMEFYEKAMDIWLNSGDVETERIENCYKCIGACYMKMKEFDYKIQSQNRFKIYK